MQRHHFHLRPVLHSASNILTSALSTCLFFFLSELRVRETEQRGDQTVTHSSGQLLVFWEYFWMGEGVVVCGDQYSSTAFWLCTHAMVTYQRRVDFWVVTVRALHPGACLVCLLKQRSCPQIAHSPVCVVNLIMGSVCLMSPYICVCA